MNSLKSLLILTVGPLMPRNELEEDVEPLLRRQRPVVLPVRALGVLEIVEDADGSFHRSSVPPGT